MTGSKEAVLDRLHDEVVRLGRAGDAARTEHVLRSILDLDPGDVRATTRLCQMLITLDRREEALAAIRAGLAHRPNPLARCPEIATLRRLAAELLRQLLRYDEALQEADLAMAADPADHRAPLLRATIRHDQRDYRACAADARRALACKPDYAEAHLLLASLHLLHGRWAEGWRAYEWGDRIAAALPLIPPSRRRPGQRRWNGEALGDGTLMVVADQGFGDCFQFARYLPWARRQCGRLAVACTGNVRPMLAPVVPDALVFDHWDDMPEFAAWLPLSGLPRLHGTTARTIPPARLVAPEARRAAWAARLRGICPAGARRIGLVWAGRPNHMNDLNRSITLDRLAPIGACPGVFLVSLQQGPAQAQIATYRGAAPLFDAGRLLGDFGDTAGLIAALDLVIAVDTAIAHLAGSLGIPVWIMLPYAPDWRWLLERHDSPWYPSARLFRAPAPQAWDDVIAAIIEALAVPDTPPARKLTEALQ